MKILLFGRGVITTQYAWAFEKAGHTVDFYVREGKKKIYGETVYLNLLDARKRRKVISENWSINVIETILPTHDYDLIIVSVNTEQIKSATEYLSSRVNKATVLFFGNIWEDLKFSVAPLPVEQVVFGFPGGGGGFTGNDLNCGFMKTVFIESAGNDINRRNEQVRSLFQNAGFKTNTPKDMQSWLWNHFALNAAMEAELLQIENGSFYEMMKSRRNLRNIGLNMREIKPLLEARGSILDFATAFFTYLPDRLLGFLLHKFIFAPNSFSGSIMKHANQKPGFAVEEIIRYAEKMDISMPRLRKALANQPNSH